MPGPPGAEFLRLLLGVFDVVFFPEPFYAARGIHQLLFSRKEGMTGGTNFHLKVLNGGPGFNYIAAGAAYGGKFIFWVYLFFHADKILRAYPSRIPAYGVNPFV
jgi:hypothetical protein